jgi:hypothetical protein
MIESQLSQASVAELILLRPCRHGSSAAGRSVTPLGGCLRRLDDRLCQVNNPNVVLSLHVACLINIYLIACGMAFATGSRVVVKGKIDQFGVGTVRFCGPVKFSPEIWVGVELDQARPFLSFSHSQFSLIVPLLLTYLAIVPFVGIAPFVAH